MKYWFTLIIATIISLPLMALEVGEKAPNFSLQGTDGKTHSLDDYIGKRAVVIAWFPRAFTKGCTIECKSLAKNGHKIRAFDAAYFMASTDKHEDNTRFAKHNAADFPLLSDPTGQTAKAYDVLIPVLKLARRVTVYIGKDGTILKIDKDINPATSAEDIARNLAELGVEKSGNTQKENVEQ
ncbi:peroxiredoxin family protein [Microbulbifer echini]|uniref:Peroxiredoxin family protein n=1 Tax=Microbulbifer echini TaxID=1529067 RepID=A0ABV4NKQ0_9GAMM|nr:redoxin domain-containing protein [uncultured Microbulbifer sp.]